MAVFHEPRRTSPVQRQALLLGLQEVGGPAASDSRPLSAHEASCGLHGLGPCGAGHQVGSDSPGAWPGDTPAHTRLSPLSPCPHPCPHLAGRAALGLPPNPPPSSTRQHLPILTSRAEAAPPVCSPPVPRAHSQQVGSQGCGAHSIATRFLPSHQLCWPPLGKEHSRLTSGDPDPLTRSPPCLSLCPLSPTPGGQPTCLPLPIMA